MRDHEELIVGGALDEARLRAIMKRGWLLRNVAVSEAKALTYRSNHDPGELPPHAVEGATLDNYRDGETPVLVWNEGDGGETRYASHEVHVGCGEICPVFAVIPYDGDMGGVPSENAHAIVHAGRDLIDLVREVVALRAKERDHQTVLDLERNRASALEAKLKGAEHDRDVIHKAYQDIQASKLAAKAEQDAARRIPVDLTGRGTTTVVMPGPLAESEAGRLLLALAFAAHHEGDTYRKSTATPANPREEALFEAHAKTSDATFALLEHLAARVEASGRQVKEWGDYSHQLGRHLEELSERIDVDDDGPTVIEQIQALGRRLDALERKP